MSKKPAFIISLFCLALLANPLVTGCNKKSKKKKSPPITQNDQGSINATIANKESLSDEITNDRTLEIEISLIEVNLGDGQLDQEAFSVSCLVSPTDEKDIAQFIPCDSKVSHLVTDIIPEREYTVMVRTMNIETGFVGQSDVATFILIEEQNEQEGLSVIGEDELKSVTKGAVDIEIVLFDNEKAYFKCFINHKPLAGCNDGLKKIDYKNLYGEQLLSVIAYDEQTDAELEKIDIEFFADREGKMLRDCRREGLVITQNPVNQNSPYQNQEDNDAYHVHVSCLKEAYLDQFKNGHFDSEGNFYSIEDQSEENSQCEGT